MKMKASEIASVLKSEIKNYKVAPKVNEAGKVIQLGDGIAKVSGLNDALSGELLHFEGGAIGIAMNLEEEEVGVVLLDSEDGIKEGNFVTRTGSVAQVPVGDVMLGRVVDPLGEPLDGKGAIITHLRRPVERVAPGVITREGIRQPLETGIKAVDTMVPIGKGQRQLIIGDRQTGKTAIAVDAILNQKGKNVNCVYVAIGQKSSTVANIVGIFEEFGAMSYTTIVMASAAASAAMQYFAPYSGCAIGEEWMERGKDVLIVFDDLSKHAVAYRTMSLLLRRPPGREAFPGDIFYLHSRLLERAGKLNKRHGGGSMTALPIVETQGGDMSAYIPTNVISITDGQIYLESGLFNSGVRPAINPGLSVSRVGGAAQIPAMKSIAAPIRTELAQYRELEAFSQFSSDLDKDTLRRIEGGKRIVEVLKQEQYNPLPIENQVVVMFAVTRGYFEKIALEDMQDCEMSMLEFLGAWSGDILREIKTEEKISKELDKKLSLTLAEFIKEYTK